MFMGSFFVFLNSLLSALLVLLGQGLNLVLEMISF